MSEHCEHCDEGCREGMIYESWAHHAFANGAGYLHWDEGRCPLCAAAQRERAAIVAWLREQLSTADEEWESTNDWALGCIERGEHLAGDDE